MLVVEVARGGRNIYGQKMGGWKIMTGGITVGRMSQAKDARRFAKNLRKLYSRSTIDPAAAAAVLAFGQMQDDNDSWDMEPEYEREYEQDFEEAMAREMA